MPDVGGADAQPSARTSTSDSAFYNLRPAEVRKVVRRVRKVVRRVRVTVPDVRKVIPPLTLACTLAPEAERMALAYARLK